MHVLAWLCFVCAAIPFALVLINLALFRQPRPDPLADTPHLSVLIPARNEERNLHELLATLREQVGCELEIIVCDDHSTDRTVEIARSFFGVTVISAPELPSGWNGKQHACWILAKHATSEIFCWLDADVRLAPDALRSAADYLRRSGAACVSGFPREITRTLAESLLLPLIRFVLLGYLPLPFMRASTSPAFAAGCGQFMLALRAPYFTSGGHAAIRASRHDGITLPRTFRQHGFRTDLFDAYQLAQCRMYEGARATWNGLLKNATEAMASPGAIFPFTVLLFFGQVLPFVLFRTSRLIHIAAWLAIITRGLTAQSLSEWWAVLLHPLSVLLLLISQWQAFFLKLAGRSIAWRGRGQT